MAPVVVAEALTKRFGDLVAVDDLSFALEAGTVNGFLGPNGAGKTTTLRSRRPTSTPGDRAATTCSRGRARPACPTRARTTC